MRDKNGGDGQGPTTGELIVRGILVLVAAFISANIILVAHAPLGH